MNVLTLSNLARVIVGALITCGIGVADVAVAAKNQPIMSDKEEGWFWYKEEPLPAPATPTPTPPPEKPQPSKPKAEPASVPFSADWIKHNLVVYRMKAIDNPTKENVTTYLYLQRLMLDKADLFTDKVMEVVKTDPLLDEEARIPFNSSARAALFGRQTQVRRQVLEDLMTKGGVFFFFSATCNFCHEQFKTVELLTSKYPQLKIRYVSKDGLGHPLLKGKPFLKDNGQFKTFGLSLVPSLVFVVPPDKVMILSQGAMALSELEERMFAAADRVGLVPDNLAHLTKIDKNGRLTDEDAQGGKELGSDDPKVWIKYLREKLLPRYGEQ